MAGVEGACVSEPEVKGIHTVVFAESPEPLQIIVYEVFETAGVTLSEPLAALVPTHPPQAVQEVALPDDHVRVVDWPEEIDDGAALIETVGVGLPCDACVVAEAVFEFTETLPVASTALMVYEYCVDAARPVSLYVVPDGDPICVPLRKIW